MTKVEPGAGSAASVREEAASLAFYESAEKRISRWLFVLSPLALIAAFAASGKQAAFGVLIGAVIGFFNHGWLHRTTRRASETLAENAQRKAGTAGKSLTGASLAFGSVARLALVTAVGYAIFRGSLQSFYGYLAGLALPVLAVCVEALYEAWHAAARDR